MISPSTGFLSQINSHRLLYDSYPFYLQIEILRISLIETESNPNRVKNPMETSIFLWKSLKNVCYCDWGSNWDWIAYSQNTQTRSNATVPKYS